MIRFIVFLYFSLIWALPAKAQDISPYPLCADLVNESEYQARGSINTASAIYEDPNDSLKDGTRARHSVNFKIDPGEKYHICSTGPFFAGQKVELVLRTLVPVFDCYTSLIAPIVIKSERDENGEFRTWAECF